MSSRLRALLLVCLSFVSASFTFAQDPAPAPDAVAEIKNPVPWFKWGTDLRLRHEYINNATTLNGDAANHEVNYERYRYRLWDTISPFENLDLNTRFTWEGRHYWTPESKPEWDWSYGIIDTANVKIGNLFGAPATLTAGRQDIMLGDGWLVMDGTPLDGSRTFFLDAARLTLDLKESKNTINLIYVDQGADPNRWIPAIGNTKDQYLTEQNERGAIFYLTNKAIPDTQLDGYFIYKHDDRILSNGDQGDVYAVGSRIAHDFNAHWTARAEGVYEFGERQSTVNPSTGDLQAWGFNSRLTYKFNDELKNQLRVTYEYLSGDNPDTKTNEAFDSLWGRWPQYSELYIYTLSGETRLADDTNLQRIAFGWQSNPTNKLELSADYHLLFANENTYAGRTGFSSSGDFRGQLITSILRYKFNPFMSGALIGEYFIPGDYYSQSRQDNAVFLRAELVFAF